MPRCDCTLHPETSKFASKDYPVCSQNGWTHSIWNFVHKLTKACTSQSIISYSQRGCGHVTTVLMFLKWVRWCTSNLRCRFIMYYLMNDKLLPMGLIDQVMWFIYILSFGGPSVYLEWVKLGSFSLLCRVTVMLDQCVPSQKALLNAVEWQVCGIRPCFVVSLLNID